eukprot:jgi/Tetstr1/460610/TSEL_000535.t1
MLSLYCARDCLATAASTNPTDGRDLAKPCVVDPVARVYLRLWRDTMAAGASCPNPSTASDPIQLLERTQPLSPRRLLSRWSDWAPPRASASSSCPPGPYIELIGAQLKGSNGLFRLDNTSSVGAVKHWRLTPTLLVWLLDLLERCDIELIAWHIPGMENTLANCLSRLCGAIDDQDWRLLVPIFCQLEATCGPFDVDASSDPLSCHSLCRAFWAHLPGWRRLLAGADGLEDLRLHSSTADTYRSSLRDYCSFCPARGATPLPATLGLLRGYIYHCTSDKSRHPPSLDAWRPSQTGIADSSRTWAS